TRSLLPRLFAVKSPRLPAFSPLSLHDALPICPGHARGNDRAIAIEQGDAGGGATEALYRQGVGFSGGQREREQIRRRVWRGKQKSEEHTAGLPSLTNILCPPLL